MSGDCVVRAMLMDEWLATPSQHTTGGHSCGDQIGGARLSLKDTSRVHLIC
jgi:hypothetical protein